VDGDSFKATYTANETTNATLAVTDSNVY
jgi:hypothetical protein